MWSSFGELPFMGRRGLGSFKRRPMEKTEVERGVGPGGDLFSCRGSSSVLSRRSGVPSSSGSSW